MITACMIDLREPDWVKNLTFGGVPTAVVMLDYGDVHVLTDDGCTLLIERKDTGRFFKTLFGMRDFSPTCEAGIQSHWGPEKRGSSQDLALPDDNGGTATWTRRQGGHRRSGGYRLGLVRNSGRATDYSGDRLLRCLLRRRCGFENAVLRLANRKRDPEFRLLPPRIPKLLGAGAALLASLPGIGTERVMEILSGQATTRRMRSQVSQISKQTCPDYQKQLKKGFARF